MTYDMKFISGLFFALMDLATLVVGIVLLFIGIDLVGSDSGEGKISLAVEQLGEISGINGNLVVFLAGLALVFAAVGYARKAFQEAQRYERGPIDTIRHFSPLR